MACLALKAKQNTFSVIADCITVSAPLPYLGLLKLALPKYVQITKHQAVGYIFSQSSIFLLNKGNISLWAKVPWDQLINLSLSLSLSPSLPPWNQRYGLGMENIAQGRNQYHWLQKFFLFLFCKRLILAVPGRTCTHTCAHTETPRPLNKHS